MSALDTLIDIIRDLRDRVRGLEQQETPFEAGVLPPSAGGTGVDNGTATLSLAASIALSGSGASSGKFLRHNGSVFVPTLLVAGDVPAHQHSGADITSGVIAAARLGSGTPSATTLLFGDGTWATLSTSDIPNLDASKITSGVIAAARLGSGTPSATTLLFGNGTWATLAASNIPNLDASKITSGVIAAARLGSGTPSATTLLFGDGTWATLAASDIPNLDASKITSGTLPITRGGTGATTASAALAALGGIDGSGTSGYIAFFNAGSSITGEANLFWDTANNRLGVKTASPAYELEVNGTINVGSVYRVSGTQVLGSRRTGWSAATGTATRSSFATSSVTLPQLAERVKALIDDLISHGVIGA